MPSLALTSGRKFSTTTSACSARRLNTSRPLGSFRFSVMARLLRCKFWKSEPWRGPPSCSPPASSSSASILMTLAPQSASCRTQVGPERTRVRSSTVKRDRACEACGMGIQGLRYGAVANELSREITLADTVKSMLVVDRGDLVLGEYELHV